MNREDILKEVHNNPDKLGESEVHFQRKGAVIATLIGLFFCAAMVAVEYFITHKMDFGKVALVTVVIGTSDLYEGIKNKSKRQIIYGLICEILTVVFLILYVKGVFFA